MFLGKKWKSEKKNSSPKFVIKINNHTIIASIANLLPKMEESISKKIIRKNKTAEILPL